MYGINGTTVIALRGSKTIPDMLVAYDAEDLAVLSLGELTALFNASAPARPVKKFRDKKGACRRVWERIPTLVARSHGAGKRQSWFAGKHLTPKPTKNPRRKLSYAHRIWDDIWLRCPQGISYEEYIAKGGRLVDLSHDHRKGRITITGE